MDLPQGWRRAGPFRSNAGFRQALAYSRDEAALRHHRRIRPSHMLAGVLRSSDDRVLAVLDELTIPLEHFVKQLTVAILGTVPRVLHAAGADSAALWSAIERVGTRLAPAPSTESPIVLPIMVIGHEPF